MSKNKKLILLLLMILAISSAVPVSAAEPVQNSVEVVTSSTDPDEIMDLARQKLPVEIQGKLVLDTTSYEVKETTYETVSKTITVKGEPEETFDEDGFSYHLTDKKLTRPGTDTKVTEKVLYEFPEDERNVPQTVTKSFIDESTGKTESAICTFVKFGINEETEDTIDIVFQNYGADYYNWLGYEVTYDGTEGILAGYEDDLLRSNGFNPRNSKIVSVEWTSEPYVNASTGDLDRDALAHVVTSGYAAEYEGIVKGVDEYEAYYEAEDLTRPVYTYEVTGTYKEKTILPVAARIGIGCVAAVVIIVAVLFALKKKKKTETQTIDIKKEK